MPTSSVYLNAIINALPTTTFLLVSVNNQRHFSSTAETEAAILVKLKFDLVWQHLQKGVSCTMRW